MEKINNVDFKALSYRERNKWMISQSKLKVFWKNKEAYFKQYVEEIVPDQEEKAHFKIWTALHYLCEVWKEIFCEKYFIQEGKMLKKDYQVALAKEWKETDWTVDELKARLLDWKIALTPWETKDVLWMYWELLRQPIADMGSHYEKEQILKVEYKWLILVATIDRASVEKWLIRDYKSCANVKTLLKDLQWWNVDYLFQVAFYALVCKIHFWKDFDVLLDITDKTNNNCYLCYWYSEEEVNEKQREIISLLDELIEENKKLEKWEPCFIWPSSDLREETFDNPAYKYLESSKQTEIYYISKK